MMYDEVVFCSKQGAMLFGLQNQVSECHNVCNPFAARSQQGALS